MKKYIFLFLLLTLLSVFIVSADEYVKDPIVFTFGSENDIAANMTKINSISYTLDGGYVKLTNKTSDPNFCLPISDMNIDTSVYKYIKIRFKCAEGQGKNLMGQIFFETDSSGAIGSAGTYTNFTFVPKEGFIDVEIDLSKLGGYKGILKTLRYDPYVGSDEIPTTNIHLDFIALFDNEKAMKKYPEALSDDEVNEIAEAIDALKTKVIRTEKPTDFVFSFGRIM